MLVLTGGDPLKRPDIRELIEYGRSLPIHVSITPSTTPMLQRDTVAQFRELGVTAMGVSLDGPTAEIHDGFRNVPGTFDYSMQALEWAREFHIPVQINTTITAHTLPHVQAMYELLRDKAAPPVRRWSLFLLVPVGRGSELDTPSADDVERLFEWVYGISEEAPFRVGTTEAPHYRRYWIQQKLAEGHAARRRSSSRAPAGVRDSRRQWRHLRFAPRRSLSSRFPPVPASRQCAQSFAGRYLSQLTQASRASRPRQLSRTLRGLRFQVGVRRLARARLRNDRRRAR